MSKNFNYQHFEIITLAGHRYTLTWNAVKRWFTSKQWWIFFTLLFIFLICFMPQNVTYDLSLRQRLFYWPLSTVIFFTVYLGVLHLGARWAVKKNGRVFYTPFATVLAVAAATICSEIYLNSLDADHDLFGQQMWLELIFDVLCISIFEAIHYAVTNPTSDRQKETDLKRWEEF